MKLKKKISGNWHSVVIWKDYIIGYIAGGFQILDKYTQQEVGYIPFYNFAGLFMIEGQVYIKDKEDRYYSLNSLKEEFELIEIDKPKLSQDKVLDIKINELSGLLEDIRAYDCNDSIITIAYKQKGIDFYTRDGEKITHFDFPGYSFIDDIYLEENKLYIADVFGLRILDISNLEELSLDDSNICKGWPKDVAIKDNLVFIADVLGVKIYNKDNDFEFISKVESNRNRIAKIIVDNNYIFMSCEATGLKIVDISDISKPKIIGGIVLTKGLWDSYIYDNYLYLAAYTEGLIKIDKSSIKKLKEEERFKNCGECIGVYANEKAVFAACSYDGFKILDHNLKLITSFNKIADRCWTLLEDNNILYVASGSDGVFIFDISNLKSLKLITRLKTQQARDLVLRDNLLYIADGRNGVVVYDIKDIMNATLVREVPASAFTRGVMVDEEFIYKADGDGGVEVYEK